MSYNTQDTLNTDALKYSFFPRAIPVWNALPASVVSVFHRGVFKSLLLRLQSQRYAFKYTSNILIANDFKLPTHMYVFLLLFFFLSIAHNHMMIKMIEWSK